MNDILQKIITLDIVIFVISIALYLMSTKFKMNSFVGYKTNLAFKSKKHWREAQKHSFRQFLLVIPLQAITHLAMYFLIENWTLNENLIMGVTFTNLILIFIYMIISTENKLKTF